MILDKSVTAEYVNAFTTFLREKRLNFGNELAILEPVIASDALMIDKVLDGSCLAITTGVYSALAMIDTHLAHLNPESISGRELRLALFMGAYLARIKLEYGNQGALKDFAMRELERIYAQSFAGVVGGGVIVLQTPVLSNVSLQESKSHRLCSDSGKILVKNVL